MTVLAPLTVLAVLAVLTNMAVLTEMAVLRTKVTLVLVLMSKLIILKVVLTAITVILIPSLLTGTTDSTDSKGRSFVTHSITEMRRVKEWFLIIPHSFPYSSAISK